MAMLRILANVAAFALVMELAVAANYNVGESNGGWDLLTSLQAWANSKNFSVGDSITFVYAPNHNVLEVSKPDYDACQTNNPVGSYSGGMTVITLSSPGNRYFICGSQGHCDRGMKVVITTATLGTSAPPPAPVAVPPSPPAQAPVAAPPPPPPQAPAAAPGTPSVPSPATSPVPSPRPSKTRAPSKAPMASPSKSPAIPTTPASSPALPPFPGTVAPSTNTPSSASKISAFAGFGTVIMMMLVAL